MFAELPWIEQFHSPLAVIGEDGSKAVTGKQEDLPTMLSSCRGWIRGNYDWDWPQKLLEGEHHRTSCIHATGNLTPEPMGRKHHETRNKGPFSGSVSPVPFSGKTKSCQLTRLKKL